MIRQLRAFHTPDELAEVYVRTYDHTRWEDHKIRVDVTIHIARWMRDHVQAQTAADLSCGDGAILRALDLQRHNCVYGDLVPDGHIDIIGSIEQTLGKIHPVDIFICSETLEHVEKPWELLAHLRTKTHALVLTTPVGEEGGGNPEHYWGWGVDDIGQMLDDAGFNIVTRTLLDPHVEGGYVHQIWGCT